MPKGWFDPMTNPTSRAHYEGLCLDHYGRSMGPPVPQGPIVALWVPMKADMCVNRCGEGEWTQTVLQQLTHSAHSEVPK